MFSYGGAQSVQKARKLFGHHSSSSKKRQKKRHQREKRHQHEERERNMDAVERAAKKSEISREAEEGRASGIKRRNEERQEIENEFNNPNIRGLESKQRSAMQNEANRHLKGQQYHALRQLGGVQGQRGISGKSGIAYAQRRDIQKQTNEARGQTTRDLDKLDADLRLKKIAAKYAGGAGEQANEFLDRQIQKDELDTWEQEKRERKLGDKLKKSQILTRQ
jgi:hypothetical protein